MTQLTKEFFEQKLGEQTRDLKAHTREQTEELARMVADGFEDIRHRLDVRERLAVVEQKLHRVEETLNITL